MIRPFLASGAHISNNSRLGPVCMKPGLASTTQGGPSPILRSQPRVWGTLEMCLHNYVREANITSGQDRHLLEDEWVVALGESRANIVIHRVDVCLVYSHALPGQAGSIVDRDVLQVRMFLPVFIKNQQKLLGTTKSKSWQKDMAASSDDSMN